jgi:hypothetical protein
LCDCLNLVSAHDQASKPLRPAGKPYPGMKGRLAFGVVIFDMAGSIGQQETKVKARAGTETAKTAPAGLVGPAGTIYPK